MVVIPIWERYFIREIVKRTCFFILCFYSLYILIDYASHRASLHSHHVKFQWTEMLIYYGCDFVEELEILLPFALLIATISTLCTLNLHNELIALMSSGISLLRLLRPFVLIGCVCTALLYVNTQYLLPKATHQLKLIDETRSHQKNKREDQFIAQHLLLEDGSTLIFQSYDTAHHTFFDVYWVRSINNIYRMKTLSLGPPPTGHLIDHLTRNNEGRVVVDQSYETKSFPQMRFNRKTLFETITPPDNLSYSELWEKFPTTKTMSEKESQIAATFYRKLFMPWLCLLVVIGPAPFCLRRTRTLTVFFIYAGALFGLVAFYLLMSAAVLLGKRQFLEPFWAIWPPFIAGTALCSWRYARLRYGG